MALLWNAWRHNHGVGPETSVHAANGDHVCTVRKSCNVNCEANAELIVRAVNCHAELLAALQEVRLMLNTALKDYDSEPWAGRVRTAIAKASAGWITSPGNAGKTEGR